MLQTVFKQKKNCDKRTNERTEGRTEMWVKIVI